MPRQSPTSSRGSHWRIHCSWMGLPMPTSSTSGRAVLISASAAERSGSLDQIAVAPTGQPPARKRPCGVVGSGADRPSVGPEHEIGIPSARGGLEQLGHEIGADHVLRHADAVEPGSPADAGAVGQHEIAPVERLAVGRVGSSQIQRMGVNEKNACRPAARPADDRFQPGNRLPARRCGRGRLRGKTAAIQARWWVPSRNYRLRPVQQAAVGVNSKTFRAVCSSCMRENARPNSRSRSPVAKSNRNLVMPDPLQSLQFPMEG